MVVTARRMTADEFLSLPPEKDTQLIDGMVVVGDARLRHQRIVFWLALRLGTWAEAHPGRGEAGIGSNFRIDDFNVFVPDAWFLREDNRPGDVLAVDGAPNLVIEVRSPSTWRYDIGRKKDGYRRRGAEELWVVDTEADRVLVFRGDDEFVVGLGDVLATPLVPGLAIDVAELFDR